MAASWDDKFVLPSSWYLCQTEQWKQFRYWYWNEIIARSVCCDGYIVKCTYCGWKGPKTKDRYLCLDHIIPYVEAPHLAFDVDNIVIACNHCNKKKGNMSIQEFLGTS
jgi:5-methylcytosine-specific restriction endonuclease McrA